MAKRRAAWFSINSPCSKCGSDVDLQLHHKDRTKKVSHKIWSWTEKRRLKELAKCVVLCRRCHNEETVQQEGPCARRHGTMSRYVYGGCRCLLCVERRRAYQRYCHLRRRTRESGVIITRSMETRLRTQAGYPKAPLVVSASPAPSA
jgi:hypothetical protein